MMSHIARPSTAQCASLMRVYVRRTLGAGGACPTPIEVVEDVGGTVALAIEVLSVFPEYQRNIVQRRSPTIRRMASVT